MSKKSSANKLEIAEKKTASPSSENRGMSGKNKRKLDSNPDNDSVATIVAQQTAAKAMKEKRPPSGYQLYLSQRSAEMKKNGEDPAGFMTSNHWKTMTDAEKGKWNDKAVQNKHKLLKESGQLETVSRIKRTPSSFILFCNDKRKTLDKTLSFKETGSELGSLWRDLPAAEKDVYVKRAAEQRKKK